MTGSTFAAGMRSTTATANEHAATAVVNAKTVEVAAGTEDAPGFRTRY